MQKSLSRCTPALHRSGSGATMQMQLKSARLTSTAVPLLAVLALLIKEGASKQFCASRSAADPPGMHMLCQESKNSPCGVLLAVLAQLAPIKR